MSSFEDFMLPCLNKKLFGIDCLGCGMQRSVALIVHGDFIAAFYMYPAIYFLILLLVAILFKYFFKFKKLNKIINGLSILSVLTIIVSFIIKITN